MEKPSGVGEIGVFGDARPSLVFDWELLGVF